ncbi:hypothetical protein JMJ56_27795 [Belnapia sp. T18]|uniref:Uncharacterized protein n=1 Tax=Belnapia arida TaxID=2804533 RepID=A0ABS1UEU8_9PROT|nr:hypothetical protein [Belnapia arida]MBL6081791.1 hypothetical protein [Belnapia arida]
MSPKLSAMQGNTEHDAYAALTTVKFDETNLKDRGEPVWIAEQTTAPAQSFDSTVVESNAKNNGVISFFNFHTVLGFLLIILSTYLIIAK